MNALRIFFLGFILIANCANAQYPNRAVKMIIPWPPGGGNDILGRLLADALGGPLGQTVVVDNRGGANEVHRLARPGQRH